MRSFSCCIAAIGVLCSVAVPLHAQCSNSLVTGTYFYLLSGTVISGTQPYTELGKLVSDGQGHVSGQSTASFNGVLGTYTLSGVYAVQGNCRGSMTLTVNGSSATTFTFEVVRGGDGILLSFSGSSGVLLGQAYRAATAACAKGSLVGSYGFLLSGVSGGVFAEEGQVVSDGNGNLNVTSVVNSNGTVVQVPGTGTYSVAADCSGTLSVSSQLGNNGYLFASVQNSQAALFLSTDAGATVSGVAQSEALPRMVLPDFAFGGGFYSALYFTNQSTLIYSELHSRRQYRVKRAFGWRVFRCCELVAARHRCYRSAECGFRNHSGLCVLRVARWCSGLWRVPQERGGRARSGSSCALIKCVIHYQLSLI
jgi:hypothetical protein